MASAHTPPAEYSWADLHFSALEDGQFADLLAVLI